MNDSQLQVQETHAMLQNNKKVNNETNEDYYIFIHLIVPKNCINFKKKLWTFLNKLKIVHAFTLDKGF